VQSFGIIKKTDRFGRITLPGSLRQRFKIEHGDGLEITIDGNSIILSKCRPRCAFCGGPDCATKYKDKHICQKCLSSPGEASTMSELRIIYPQVTDIINAIGIPTHFKGYFYVREAILLVIENADLVRDTTKILYPLIAEKHGTTPGNVQGNIRHFIRVACSRGNTPFIDRLFGPGAAERGITNKEFIATLADLLKNGYFDVLIRENYSNSQT